MENVGTLDLFAEPSVGVLGFSGVEAALGRGGAGEWTAVGRIRLLHVLELTLDSAAGRRAFTDNRASSSPAPEIERMIGTASTGGR